MTTDGMKVLGTYVGKLQKKQEFVKELLESYVNINDKLATFACSLRV